jgi:hypothetical protein
VPPVDGRAPPDQLPDGRAPRPASVREVDAPPPSRRSGAQSRRSPLAPRFDAVPYPAEPRSGPRGAPGRDAPRGASSYRRSPAPPRGSRRSPDHPPGARSGRGPLTPPAPPLAGRSPPARGPSGPPRRAGAPSRPCDPYERAPRSSRCEPPPRPDAKPPRGVSPPPARPVPAPAPRGPPWAPPRAPPPEPLAYGFLAPASRPRKLPPPSRGLPLLRGRSWSPEPVGASLFICTPRSIVYPPWSHRLDHSLHHRRASSRSAASWPRHGPRTRTARATRAASTGLKTTKGPPREGWAFRE